MYTQYETRFYIKFIYRSLNTFLENIHEFWLQTKLISIVAIVCSKEISI